MREREIFWQSLGCNVLNVHHYQGCLHRYTSTYFHIFIHSFDCQAELLSCSPWLVSGWHQWGYWYIILIVHVIMTSVRNYFLFPLDFSETDCKLLHAFLYIVTRVPRPLILNLLKGVCVMLSAVLKQLLIHL